MQSGTADQGYIYRVETQNAKIAQISQNDAKEHPEAKGSRGSSTAQLIGCSRFSLRTLKNIQSGPVNSEAIKNGRN
ncbi:MAG: hypothetical protein WBQ23_04620 [Bacteroidota bacterium]